jgi:hypothetical protein
MDRAKQREIASKGGIASHRRRREQQGDGSMDVATDDNAVAMDRGDRTESAAGYASERDMSAETISDREE